MKPITAFIGIFVFLITLSVLATASFADPISGMIGGAAVSAVGDPVFIGILILGFFGGFVFLQGVRTDARLLVLVPATLLAAAYIPWLPLLLGLICAGIVYLAFTKFDQR